MSMKLEPVLVISTGALSPMLVLLMPPGEGLQLAPEIEALPVVMGQEKRQMPEPLNWQLESRQQVLCFLH